MRRQGQEGIDIGVSFGKIRGIKGEEGPVPVNRIVFFLRRARVVKLKISKV